MDVFINETFAAKATVSTNQHTRTVATIATELQAESQSFAEAADNISAALAGTRETRNSVKLGVNGDMHKLRNAPGLSPPLSALSKQMFESFHATCKRVEGSPTDQSSVLSPAHNPYDLFSDDESSPSSMPDLE